MLFITITIILLISCENKDVEKEESNKEEFFYTFHHPSTSQKFNIINVYKLYENYEQALKQKSDASSFTIFNQKVLNPIYNACYKGGEHFRDTIQPPKDLKEINNTISSIDEKQLNNSIKEALIESSNYLPSEKTTNVCVFPVEGGEYAESAYTTGSGKISLFYRENYDVESLKALIAHEYHHSIYTEKFWNKEVSNNWTLLDNLVAEGKAVMFEKIVYPDITWTPIRYNTNTEIYWKELIQPNLYKKNDANLARQILLGGNGIPYDFGYSEGYKIVKSYLELNPNLTAEEWTALSAKEIFENGDYMNN